MTALDQIAEMFLRITVSSITALALIFLGVAFL
jgi:hypothetical protein